MRVPSFYEPDRIPRPYADPNCQGGILEEATAICLRCHRAGPSNQAAEYTHLTSAADRRAGRFAISNLVRPIEERELTRLAIGRNVLFSNGAFTKRWIEQGRLGGAENDIYYREGKWVKRNHLNYHSSYLEFFYRLTLQNYFFPSCPVELIGFVRVEGVLKPLFRQTDVEARRGATRHEVGIALAEIGFTRDGDRDDYCNEEIGIRIEDLHDQNVLINESGLEFIDPVVYLDERSKAKRLALS